VRDADVGGKAERVVARALDLRLQAAADASRCAGISQSCVSSSTSEKSWMSPSSLVSQARPEDRVGHSPRLGQVGSRGRDALELDAQLAVVLQRDRHGLPHAERRAAVPATSCRRPRARSSSASTRCAPATRSEALPQVVGGIDVGREAAGESGRQQGEDQARAHHGGSLRRRPRGGARVALDP
jgi:hypothetical protein